MINNPTITLCILAYNRPKDLENTIKSYLWQDFKNSEMVIIDDASPKNLKSVVSRWIKKDDRIKYFKNKTNLGLSANFNKSFNACKGKYVLFLGDDDIFITSDAITNYVSAFKNHNVGVLRSRQVIIRNGKVLQVAQIENNGKTKFFNKGYESSDKFVIDTTSIAGLAFLNDEKLKSLLYPSETMYPQLELASKMSLFYKTVQINKYLIGVGSNESQLNVISYTINGFKTNILDDLVGVHRRVGIEARENGIKIVREAIFVKKIISFLPIFLPYNTIKNGKKNTFIFILKMLSFDNSIFSNKLFLYSLLLVFFPKLIILKILTFLNKAKLKKSLRVQEIKEMNQNVNLIMKPIV